MRCGCPDCGAYMAHAEGPDMGCACPHCGVRCRDCLGAGELLSREALRERLAALQIEKDDNMAGGTPHGIV